MSESKFFSNLSQKINDVIKVCSDNDEEWKPRYEALEDLEKLVEEGAEYKKFPSAMKEFQNDLGIAMITQMTDLRSEIVRQAGKCVTALARECRQSYKIFVRKIMPTLIDQANSRNSTVSRYTIQCVHPVLQSVHSKNIMFIILDQLNQTKSKQTQENCTDFMRTCLAFWPVAELNKYKQVIMNAIAHCLKCATVKTRELGAKCFWLFAGHFPKLRDKFMATLDARTQRIVERGKTAEEEEEENEAATKIAKVMRGVVTRKRVRQSVSFGKNIAIGDRVRVGDTKIKGVTRYRGELTGKTGIWIGIEADEPVRKSQGLLFGDKDGSLDGKSYFECEKNFGFFASLVDVHPAEDLPAIEKRDNNINDDDDDDESIPEPKFRSVKLQETYKMDNQTLLQQLLSARKNRGSARIIARNRSKNNLGANGKLNDDVSEEEKREKAKTELLVANKNHLRLLGDLFNEEMDFFAKGIEDPSFVDGMIKLLSQMTDESRNLLALFKSYKNPKQKKVKFQDACDDDFLDKNDHFN